MQSAKQEQNFDLTLKLMSKRKKWFGGRSNTVALRKGSTLNFNETEGSESIMDMVSAGKA